MADPASVNPPDPNASPLIPFNVAFVVVSILGFLSLVVCLLATWVLCAAVIEVSHQRAVIASLSPVRAEVISARSGPQPWARQRWDRGSLLARAIVGPDHEVWVSYRYTVDGIEYVSGEKEPKDGLDKARDAMSPGFWSGQVGLPGSPRPSLAGNESWARLVLADYAPGRGCKAYYDPDAPSRCCLLKEPEFTPYGAILISLPFVCFFAIGAPLATLPLLWLVERLLWPLGYRLPETWLNRLPRRWMIFLTWVYVIGWCLAVGHYFALAPRPFDRHWAPLLLSPLMLVPPVVFWFRLIPSLGLDWLDKPRPAPEPAKPSNSPRLERRQSRKRQRLAKKSNRQK